MAAPADSPRFPDQSGDVVPERRGWYRHEDFPQVVRLQAVGDGAARDAGQQFPHGPRIEESQQLGCSRIGAKIRPTLGVVLVILPLRFRVAERRQQAFGDLEEGFQKTIERLHSSVSSRNRHDRYL